MTIAPEGRKMLRIEARNAEVPIERKPEWIRTKATMGPEYNDMKSLVKSGGLHVDENLAHAQLRVAEFLEDGRLFQVVDNSSMHGETSTGSGIEFPLYDTGPEGMDVLPATWEQGLQRFLPQFDELPLSRDNREVAFLQQWACGAAGSALPWHGRGHRFDPDQVHQII